MIPQGIQECRGEAEVSLHKFPLVLRAIDPCEIKDKVCVGAISIQVLTSRVNVVLIYLIHRQVTIVASLAITNILQLFTEISPHEALGSCY